MQIQALSFEQLVGAVAVILLFLGIYNTAMSAIKNWREEKKLKDSPITKLTERVDRHDTLLEKDKDRLDALEQSVRTLQTEGTLTLKSVKALLSHGVNGNSTDKMTECIQEIDDYLISRK